MEIVVHVTDPRLEATFEDAGPAVDVDLDFAELPTTCGVRSRPRPGAPGGRRGRTGGTDRPIAGGSCAVVPAPDPPRRRSIPQMAWCGRDRAARGTVAPTAESIRATRAAFAAWVAERRGLLRRPDRLRRPVALVGRASRPVLGRRRRWTDVLPGVPDDRVLTDRGMPGAVWFPGTTINFAEQALRWATDEHPALIVAAEDREPVEVSWETLRGQVGAFAATLRRLRRRPRRPGGRLPAQRARGGRRLPRGGVHRRGVVLLRPDWHPRRPRPVRPDRAHGAGGGRRLPLQRQELRPPGRRRRAAGRAADRAGDRRRPPAVPTEVPDGALALGRGRRRHPGAGVRGAALRPPVVDRLLRRRPDCPRGSCTGTAASFSSSASKPRCTWTPASGTGSSGTPPPPGSWNIATSALLSGATVVVYDGAPTYPSVDALFGLAARTGITYFGTSPGYLGACEKAGERPGERHDPSAVRSIGVTGSPCPRRPSGGSTTR